MDGLVAIVSRDRRQPVDEAELDALVQAYESLRGAGGRSDAAAGTWARAAKLSPPGFARGEVARAGDSWAAVAGVAYGGGQPPLDVEELEGQFALVGYDAGRDELTVAADPFAMHGLYVAERGDRTYVSTSALALARHLRASPSRFGLELFLRAGYHFGAATHWESIERLEPARRLVFRRDGVERPLYWRPPVDGPARGESFTAAVARVREAALETFGATLAARPGAWSDLTGGYDSRLLNLFLDRAGVAFATDTRGRLDLYDEVRIARRVAEVAGWEWLNVPLPEDWPERLPSLVPPALAWSDGHLDVLELVRVLCPHAQLAERRPSLLLGGGGEHFRGFAWRQEFLAAGRSTRVNMRNWIDMRLIHPLDGGIFATDPTAAVRDDLARRMAAWAEPYAGELNTTQLDVMYAYKVTGHFGAFRSADGAFLDSELPFYLRPVFTAAFTTSHRHRDGHRLMRHLIHALDPRVAAVPTTTGGPAEPRRATNLHRFAPYYADLARRASAKLAQRVVGRPLLASRSQFSPAVELAQRAYVRGAPLDFTGLRSAPLYSRGAYEELVRRAREGSLGVSSLLGRIVTVELALRAADAAVEPSD